MGLLPNTFPSVLVFVGEEPGLEPGLGSMFIGMGPTPNRGGLALPLFIRPGDGSFSLIVEVGVVFGEDVGMLGNRMCEAIESDCGIGG
jgi:hypothetical protein